MMSYTRKQTNVQLDIGENGARPATPCFLQIDCAFQVHEE